MVQFTNFSYTAEPAPQLLRVPSVDDDMDLEGGWGCGRQFLAAESRKIGSSLALSSLLAEEGLAGAASARSCSPMVTKAPVGAATAPIAIALPACPEPPPQQPQSQPPQSQQRRQLGWLGSGIQALAHSSSPLLPACPLPRMLRLPGVPWGGQKPPEPPEQQGALDCV